LGVVQFAIGLAMVAGYRRAGVWGVLNQRAVARRAPDSNLVLSASELGLLVNDAVNVLPCATWSYLNGGPLLTCAPFPGQR
jgi:hypothetical protein